MRITRTLTGLGLAAALTLTAAACGDDDDGVDTDATEDSGEGSSDGMATREDLGTIVDVAAGNREFSTLVDAVTAADLGATLSGNGPFTVFAPVNGAFAKLPAGALDSLLQKGSKDELTTILTYHVVPAEVISSDLDDGQVVTTVQGETLTVGIKNGVVTLTDQLGGIATVTTADIEASNGVIHVIDSVLLPSS